MEITITSIRLRSVWGFFRLSNHGRKIVGQMKKSEGFIRYKNTGFGYLHFTISAWENAAARSEFAKSGAHLAAMKDSAKLATEIKTYSYTASELPDWKSAKILLETNGKSLKF